MDDAIFENVSLAKWDEMNEDNTHMKEKTPISVAIVFSAGFHLGAGRFCMTIWPLSMLYYP